MALHAASVTSVDSLATNATLKDSNPGRRGLIIENTDANALYVKYGATASATSFTFSLAQGGKYVMSLSELYTGRIDGIWAGNGSGAAKITEW